MYIKLVIKLYNNPYIYNNVSLYISMKVLIKRDRKLKSMIEMVIEFGAKFENIMKYIYYLFVYRV